MADHQEMIHAAAAPAMYGGGGSGGTGSRVGATQAINHGGDWWSTPPAGFGAGGGWSAAPAGGGSHVDVVDGNYRSRSGTNMASSESPGSNSLVATGSSITFQEPAGGADPVAAISVPQTAAAGWNQQPFMDGTGFHGYYMSPRGDHAHNNNTPSLMSPSSSNNNMMLQDQNYQFLSSIGFELLSSPTSPSGSFRSSLLRSLTEPTAAKPNSPRFQQYQPAMNHMITAASSTVREPLQFTNNTPFWNPSAAGFAAAVDGASLGAARPQPASHATKSALEGVGDSGSIVTRKAKADPPPLKKSRTGAPSPLPTFKVRKEKLGDRVTALQQLVSPFGKTDTASVLHETIEYIKFLHDQVAQLSAPYLKNRQQAPHLKSSNDGDEGAAAIKRDLTGRGLCLVPISSTFAVASETPVDFWTPFGAGFRC